MSDLRSLRGLVNHAIATLRDPRAGAAEVLRAAPGRDALWLSFALVVTLSLIGGEIMSLLMGPPEEGFLTGQPSLVMGLLQAAILFLMVHAITHIGRLFGGTGSFDNALALVIWLQFIFLLIQGVQLALLLISPHLAALVSVIAIGLFFYLLVSFIAEMHGFVSPIMVFFMTIASFILIVFALSVVMNIIGITPELIFDPA